MKGKINQKREREKDMVTQEQSGERERKNNRMEKPKKRRLKA